MWLRPGRKASRPFLRAPDPFSPFVHYPTDTIDDDAVFNIGDMELEEPIRLAHVAR